MAERTEMIGERQHSSTDSGKPRVPKKPSWRETPSGRVLELLAYLIMLVLALVYFTGKGLFIYEGF